MDPLIYVFVPVFIAIIASRTITERANKHLDQEQKAGLVDLFSEMRTQGVWIIVGLIVVFFANMKFKFIPANIALSVYFFVLVAYMILLGTRSNKILRENNYPREYIKMYLLASSIRLAGILAMVAGLMYFG